MIESIIEMRVAKIWFEDDGVIRVIFLPGAEVTLEDMKEINVISTKLSENKKVPVFTDIREIKSMTREARLFASSEIAVKVTSAVAALTGTPVSRVLANFFMGINKPPFPTRLFTSEAKALEWLKGFTEKEE